MKSVKNVLKHAGFVIAGAILAEIAGKFYTKISY
jgi:hypothetical protein